MNFEKLIKHLENEHDLILIESEIQEIERISIECLTEPKRSEQLVCRYCKTELTNPISKRAGYCDSWCVEREEAK